MTSVCDIIQGDMRKVMYDLFTQNLCVDLVLTDAPYHLGSITKRFGKPDSAPAKHGHDGAAARLSRGFMGWSGDSGEIAFDPDTWALVRDVMKPGGRLACFTGSRTWWKVAAAIDAAGFECEDTMFWTYGQGLVLRRSRMKPCVEPIVLFRKPGPVQNLNIDDCRIPSEGGRFREDEDSQDRRYAQKGGTNFAAKPGPRGGDPKGRWPGNLIHDDSDEVLSCFPDAPGQLAATRADGTLKQANVYGRINHGAESTGPREDKGSAARFFTRCEWSEEEQVSRLAYQAKAPSGERVYRCGVCGEDCLHAERTHHLHGRKLEDGSDDWSHLHSHPTLKPLSLLRHLVRLLAPKEGLVLDPFAGTGTTPLAAKLEGRDAIGVEMDERYVTHARLRLESA